MFKRLRNRLLLFNMVILSMVVIASFAVIYFITYTNIQKENHSKLKSVPMLAITPPGNPDLQELPPNIPHQKTIIRIPVDFSLSFTIMVDNDGKVMDVLSYIDLPDEIYHKAAERIWSRGKNEGTISFESRKWQYRISPFENKIFIKGNNGQEFIYGNQHYRIALLDITDSSRTLTQLLITFVLVGIAMLFILFLVSFHFANRSIRPIEDNWEKQKRFVADASHELKTPLSIIGANADALLANGEETVNSQKKWIEYIQSEAGRMAKLVNDMLYLARAEDTSGDQIPFDLSNTVLDAVASMEAIMFEKGIRLTQAIEPDIIVKGDGERIKQAVLILLDNAVKYSDNYGSVNITLERLKNNAVLSVQNSGEDIPADKLLRIFDRFYRSDPSRSQETSGYGLGLSIAKAVIQRSGGSIQAESANDSTTFTFKLKTV